ncbi:unnamed protein product (macronuclear) [Paramecium tetraurelia]|uniref:Uncharacterized protein n=1 Tax=Paramecium tetraurelia TaxID=5888 RepID=A0BLG7_PARTE|nr:uncharacterized protein GSPATT00030017001 [Paramecium tetraurelia]CAK59384.1 unnamed protein product [Paramecium tetraurelia]|eukprot:XP_001426782.1 hypothetical protein (macronuclear) [Paramecium tetraurelia strain d4-2]
MIENEEQLLCSNNQHIPSPAIAILLDKDLEGTQQLVCQQCVLNHIGCLNGISITQGLVRIQQLKEQIFDQIGILFQETFHYLKIFQEKILQVKQEFLQTINQVIDPLELWMKQLEELKEGYSQYSIYTEINNLTKPTDLLIEQEKQQFQNRIQKINNQYLTKTAQYLKVLDNFIADKKLLLKLNQLQDSTSNKEKILNEESVNTGQQKESNQAISQSYKQERIQHKLIQEVYQEQECHALDFNKDNSLVAASCKENIKIWKFIEGQLINQNILLTGHESDVFCILFSKKINWIVSGDKTNQIRSWIECKDVQGKTYWQSSLPLEVHKSEILCLHLNKNEDELISASGDSTIKVWGVNCNLNKIEFQYSLEKHTSYVDKISLNSTETNMVSCGWDQQIIVWEKDDSKRWQFKYIVEQSIEDIGFRIGFLQDDTVVWCQLCEPFLHVFKLQNGTFQERSDLIVKLQNIKTENNYNDFNLFQLKYLQQEKVLIFKYNRYVYLMRETLDSTFIFPCEPIDCQSIECYGNITDNGRYLIVWNEHSKQLQSFEIEYQ